jgi:formiminotetrahydrofolate cyclodeaminase
MNDLTVANTILAQLGGKRFTIMTGVKNLVGDKNSLTMKLPKCAIKAKWLKITLNSLDLYDVEFITESKGAIKTVKSENNLYNDQLVNCFEQNTHLYTKL